VANANDGASKEARTKDTGPSYKAHFSSPIRTVISPLDIEAG
jgi:hypothetical protein